MSKIRLAALAATMVMSISVFAQETQTTTTTTTVQTAPPSTTQVDTARANQQAADIVNNPDVHWTIKERTELFMNAPYVRPRDQWELAHMFRMLPANEEKVMFEALTDAMRANAGDFYTRRAMMDTYWQNRMNGTASTTVTSSPSGMTTVVTTTTTPDVRTQGMVGSGAAVVSGLNAVEAWELMQRDLDAEERTTFRMVWNNMTSSQQEAMINIVRQSSFYYNARNAGRYGYYWPY